MKDWIVKPDKVKERVIFWQKEYPKYLEVATNREPTGYEAYCLTITNKSIPSDKKEKLFISVPHAHEPAGTAACIEIINQLLTGKTLAGQKISLKIEEVLKRIVLTIIPDANPDGRARAPVEYWDGKKYTNNQFWCYMRREDPDNPGKMWKRTDIWDKRKEKSYPNPIGIVYEPIDRYRYVEPNRSWESSLFKLYFEMAKKHRYSYWLDLHQTEFGNSKYNCEVILPTSHLDAPSNIQRKNERWAEIIVNAWKEYGANPKAKSEPLCYTGVQKNYFVKCWKDIQTKISMVSTEVQNNNKRTPPKIQKKLQEIAIRRSLEMILK